MRHLLLSVFLALAVVMTGAPDAFAKAGSKSGGSSSSFGSRGSRTNDRPMERTLAPPSPQAAPKTYGPPPAPVAPPKVNPVQQAPLGAPGSQLGSGAMMPAAQPSFFQRHPFVAGMTGGLVGAGIGSMLFGHSSAMAGASELSPAGSMLGTLLQFALIGGLIWFLVRLFRRSGEAAQGASNPYARTGAPSHAEPVLASSPPPRVEKEFEPSPEDKNAFGEILFSVQKAWSDGDLMALKRYATPEVVAWLSEDLSANASRGLINKVENVALVKGDVTESWRENGVEFATADMTFSCLDYMVQAETGAVAEGNPRAPVQHREAWTFMRSSGGRWLLSAVEQE